jgi:hypothetical protein
MLVIRQAQMEALRKSRRRSFENAALARWVRRRAHAENTETPESVRSAVQAGIQRALRYGLQQENDILRFLDLTCDFGTGLDEAASILDDKDLAPATKLTLMEQQFKSSPPVRG